VAASTARDSERPARPVDPRNQRSAALSKAGLTAIVGSYAQRIEATRHVAVSDASSMEQMLTDAKEMVLQVADSVAAGDGQADPAPAAWPAVQPRPDECRRPADAFGAVMIFQIVTAALTRYVTDDPALPSCFAAAVVTPDESINTRIRKAAAAHAGYLLDRVHEARIAERRRIARELRDWLGEGICLGLRRLDLHEISVLEDPAECAAITREALAGAMRRLRVVTSDLREEPRTSLEKVLTRYLDSLAPGAHVRPRVSGGEVWVPPAVIDEAFLIIRESIRSALTHGAPHLVMVAVDLSPRELGAYVKDDGRGFGAAEGVRPLGAGNRLVSMRERAALIRGRLRISSAPGHGARVDLTVPLPGHRHD
jgi:signal transduction histidine kinase